jgi:hypothetical protein
MEASFEERQPAARLRDDRDWRERLRDWFQGVEAETPPPKDRPLLDPKPGRIGICCSGGGIRSAAYNLGALQALQEEKVLGAAEYVAAVSGGSYIAASYATVAARSEIGENDPPVYSPGSPEEQHLRNHSTYMAPGAGGQIRFLLRILLGLAVNLAFIAGALLVLGRLLGWLYADRLYPELKTGANTSLSFEWWAWLAFLPLIVGVGLALPDLVRRLRNDRRRRRLEAWSTRLIGLGLLLYVMLIALPWTLEWVRDDGPSTLFKDTSSDVGAAKGTQLFGFVNVAAVLAALAGSLRAFVARKRSWFALGAGAIAGPLIVLTTFGLFVNEASLRGWGGLEFGWLGLGLVIVGAWFFVGDLTQWSLHPFYRRRLSSAFFVRRTTDEEQENGAGPVQELPFTEPLYLSELDAAGHFPKLIVCAAANLSDEGVTPPGRNAASFTFSSEEVGGLSVGVVSTADFEGFLKGDGNGEGNGIGTAARDATLPAAVAMSGAAVSPSMGKHSVRALRFLLALTNVRLGVWIPNPRWIEELATHRRGSRGHLRPPPWYLVHELLGRNKVNHKYLYISDGGHFENLGLVELLRRGCTTIFCFDASGDSVDTFNTLGEAVALARTEVQVDVEIEPEDLKPEAETGLSPTDHTIGTFRYLNTKCRQNDDGLLVFAKAAVTADAPWDVRAFGKADKRFPNHSTFDQLFDDQKFESYRALGAHTARRAIRTWMERVTKATAREQLIRVARARRQITYGELVSETNANVPEPVQPPTDLKPLLHELDEEERSDNRPPLSAVLVHETTFNRNDLVRRIRTATTDRRRADLLHRAWDHWSATPLPREELSGEAPDGVPQPV